MAYLRKRRIGNGTYYYILECERLGGKPVQRCLQYLGRDPDKNTLKGALWKWGVKGSEPSSRVQRRRSTTKGGV